MTKAGALMQVTVAYLVAVAVGGIWLAWGPATSGHWLDALIADLLATVVIFIFSRAYRNSSFYDAYWSVIPPLLLAYWIDTAPLGVCRVPVWLLGIVLVLWAVRLTWNWAYGFLGLHHEDWRYPMVREAAGRWALPADLFGIHVFPTLQVFAAMVPAYVVVTTPGRRLNALDVVAFAVGLAAITLELVADAQMHRFVRDRQPGEVMERGVWAWSRHPNYFGEFCLWVSVALFGIANTPSTWWWQILGAVAMLAMFLSASIPMMEKRSLERRPTYADVIARVPMFLPRPPHRP